MVDTKVLQMSDPLFGELLHGVSGSMKHAVDQGMEPLQAAVALIIAVTDYARAAHGDDIVDQLSRTVQMRRGLPLAIVHALA